MNQFSESVIKEKNYLWLLTELSREKQKLRILEVAFLKSEHVESGFYTNIEEIISPILIKSAPVREILKKYASQRINGLESPKPVAYAVYSSSRKILFDTEIDEILKKDMKLHNLKELYLFQDYVHDHTTYYNVDLYFDGEGLLSTFTRKDINNPETSVKDTKYFHIALNFSEYLVKMIENLIDENIVRLNYDIIIDLEFMPRLFSINVVKTAHPKIITLNKGLNADQLESVTLLKSETKNLFYARCNSVIKEPEVYNVVPVEINKPQTTSIFANFVSNFLSGEFKKNQKNKAKIGVRSSVFKLINDEPEIESEKKIIIPDFVDFSENNGKVLNYPEKKIKIPTSYSSFSLRNNKGMLMFPSLVPSPSLSNFLVSEKQRILSNRAKPSQEIIEKLERLGKTEKLPKILKDKKKQKKIKKKSKKQYKISKPDLQAYKLKK